MLCLSLSLLEECKLITLNVISQPESQVLCKSQLNFSKVDVSKTCVCILSPVADEEFRSTWEQNCICAGSFNAWLLSQELLDAPTIYRINMENKICCWIILCVLRHVADSGAYNILKSEDFTHLIVVFFILITYLDLASTLTDISIWSLQSSL